MKNQKIRVKMLCAFGFILLLMVVLNAFSLANLRRISNMSLELGNNPQIQALADGVSDSFLTQVHETTNQVIVGQDIIFVVILVATVLTALRLSATLTTPIRVVAEGVGHIAQGHLDTEIRCMNQDEIGMLANNLNNTMQNIKGYVYDISHVLGEIGNGNIALEVDREYIGDFSEVKNSLNRIISQLNHTISEISYCCNEVRAGSSSLADNAQTLAQGAAEQSAALDEFQVSLRRVTELTAQDAQNASAVKQISEDATSSAIESDGKMTQMTQSMNEIEASSQEIAKVIKIIDDIAFQTNILALNAAVEAARAGVAGKGFAVVADEVRNLANKSQEAAKNTTDMINKAVSAVNDGKQVAEDSAKALHDVREHVMMMAQRLEDIDKSTTEQAENFSRMLTAVDGISGIIHSNAAAAEENSTASEELSRQVERLEELVGEFRLRRSRDDSYGNFRSTGY